MRNYLQFVSLILILFCDIACGSVSDDITTEAIFTPTTMAETPIILPPTSTVIPVLDATPFPTPIPIQIHITAITSNSAILESDLRAEMKLLKATSTFTPSPLPTVAPEMQREAIYFEIKEKYLRSERIVTSDFAMFLTEILNSDRTQMNIFSESFFNEQFEVVSHYQIPNLFGNNKEVELLQISVKNLRDYIGAVFLLSEQEPGQYQVIPLENEWSELERGEEIITVDDFNGNGQSDIAKVSIQRYPRSCHNHLSVFEWQGNQSGGRFVNIGENIEELATLRSFHGCDNNVWRFGSPDAQGIRPIFQIKTYGYINPHNCSEYQTQTRYVWWDGAYQKEKTTSIPFDKTHSSYGCDVNWASTVMGIDSIEYIPEPEIRDTAIHIIEVALKNWSAEYNEIWGPASEDYFRFRLGTWYAIQGDIELAQDTLQQVSNHPNNPEYTFVPKLAEVYLSSYRNSQNIKTSCQVVIDEAKKTLPYDTSMFAIGVVKLIDEMDQIWGFTEGANILYGYDWNYICNIGMLEELR